MDTNWVPNLSAFQGPKYQALAAALREGVELGALAPGQKVPTVRDLAWKLGITPGTVARAYTILRDAGVFDATVGRGTFVADLSATLDEAPLEVDANPHGASVLSGDINLFSPALPNVGQARLIRTLMAEVAQDPPSGLMHYPTRAAFEPARRAVVQWLKGTPVGQVDEADVVLSHGGQNGISLALQSILTGARPVILVEDLAYPGFQRAADLLRAEVVRVPMDKEGIVPGALASLIQKHGAQVLCTSPEVHNPTGCFTPQTRRLAIAAVCKANGVQIIEDDCYRLGLSKAQSYRMLAPERGWYVSSISKTLTPALRIGFVIAPKDHVAGLRLAAEHGFFGIATPLADLTAKLLAHPDTDRLASVVTQRIGAYVQSAVNHLGRYDLNWRPDVPFVWLTLPPGWRAGAFCQSAAERGVLIRPAEDFAPRDARAPHAVRIAMNAQISIERFDGAMRALSDLVATPPERIGV